MFKLLKSIIKSTGRAIHTDPEVQKLTKKYPRIFHFIRKRVTPDEEFGLRLTMGVLVTIFFVYLFFGVLQDYIGQDPLILSDLRIINLVQIFRDSLFSNITLFITYLGNWQIVFVGMILICTILALLKHWHYLIALLVSAGGGEFFVWVMKNLIARPRPPLINALAPDKGFSFPSGHSFVSISFYGLAAYFALREIKSKFLKTFFIILGILIIFAIGFSRIYLGAHWPSDVLASYASGAAWLTMLVTALEIRRKFNHREYGLPYLKKSNIKILGVVFILIWISVAVYFFKTHPLAAPHPAVIESRVNISSSDIPKGLFLNLPKTSEDITGNTMEPIDIIIVGSREKLDQALKSAGWVMSDNITARHLWRLLSAVILNQPYPQAPGSPSFWNALPNDFAYAKDTPVHSVRERHHVHFWETPFLVNGKENIWFTTAHFDKAIKVRFGIFLPTHSIDPAIDKERDQLESDFARTGYAASIKEFQIVEPTLGQNQTGDQFFTDGKAYIIFLK